MQDQIKSGSAPFVEIPELLNIVPDISSEINKILAQRKKYLLNYDKKIALGSIKYKNLLGSREDFIFTCLGLIACFNLLTSNERNIRHREIYRKTRHNPKSIDLGAQKIEHRLTSPRALTRIELYLIAFLHSKLNVHNVSKPVIDTIAPLVRALKPDSIRYETEPAWKVIKDNYRSRISDIRSNIGGSFDVETISYCEYVKSKIDPLLFSSFLSRYSPFKGAILPPRLFPKVDD